MTNGKWCPVGPSRLFHTFSRVTAVVQRSPSAGSSASRPSALAAAENYPASTLMCQRKILGNGYGIILVFKCIDMVLFNDNCDHYRCTRYCISCLSYGEITFSRLISIKNDSAV